jgi:hypothetical protein
VVEPPDRAEVLSRALRKLPAFVGLAYRAHASPAGSSVLDGYVVGRVLQEPAFVSASLDPVDWGNAHFRLASTQGKVVMDFSPTPAEREVVFDKGSCFEVLSHTVRAGLHWIDLVEVAAPSLLDTSTVHPPWDTLPDGPRSVLNPAKQDFLVGIRPDGTPNTVGVRHIPLQ